MPNPEVPKTVRRILVVDDEPDVERLVRQRMRREIRAGRYSFEFAANGVEALEVLRREPDIDVMLSDINMPQMDGLALLDQISKADLDIRSVIVSAYGDMKNIRTAMNRGAFDFVTKPIDFNDLRVTIDRALANVMVWREALASRDKLVSLQNELGVAAHMQKSILPTSFPSEPRYEVFANMEPAREVGGDFYDVIPLENGRLGLAIADVSDKGVPAALFMMSARTLLKGTAIGCDDPAEVLRIVNELLQENNEAMMFLTVFYAIYDPQSGELAYANAGHNHPVVVRADGASEEIGPPTGVAAGVIPGLSYEAGSARLAPGDLTVFYTDGVNEAINESEEEFGMERLVAASAGARRGSARAVAEAVLGAVSDFAGDEPQFDDITCLTLVHKGDPS